MSNKYARLVSVRCLNTAAERSPRCIIRPALFHWVIVAHIVALGFCSMSNNASQYDNLQNDEILLSDCSHISGFLNFGYMLS
ncbi:MAG: hypothetical protein ACI4JS_01670 [Oscillospiraceae bacterium]